MNMATIFWVTLIMQIVNPLVPLDFTADWLVSFQNLVVKFINLLQLNRRVNVSQQLTTPNVGPFKIQGENCRGSFL